MTGLCVDFAGVPVEARSSDAAWIGGLRQHYSDFVTDAPAQLVVTYVRGDEPSDGWAVGDAAAGFHLFGESDPERVGAVVRQALPDLIGDGLSCHAALLEEQGRGYLCCGASGAGKSTLARLLPQHARCDELAVVRARAQGFAVAAAPYGVAHPAVTTLHAIFLLRHSAHTVRRRLPAGRAVAALSDHIAWPVEEAEPLARAFALLTRLVEQVPVFDLGFVPTPDVWQTISGED